MFKFFLTLVSIILNVIVFCQSKEITVEDIWKKGVYRQKSFEGFNSMSDGEHFLKIENDNNGNSIVKYSFNNYKGKGEVFVSSNQLAYNQKNIEIDDYKLSNDENKILIQSNTKNLYRHSYYADFYIFDKKNNSLSKLDETKDSLTLADFSPDGNKVAFIYKNNIYVKDLLELKTTQLTFDGRFNYIINGTTDWVYEEEFSFTKAFYWSPDSKYIAFLKFDESKVRQFQIAMYGKLYPDQYLYKYPKAGEDNSKVSCYIINVNALVLHKLNIDEYEYIPRINWSNSSNILLIQTLNRNQNHVKYISVNADKGNDIKTVFEEKSSIYIDIDDNLYILNDDKSFLRTSESTGYKHIQRVFFDGKTEFITSGSWDVIEFLGLNEKTKTIYYSSSEKGAIYKGIYCINLNGKNKKALSSEYGQNSAYFSNNYKYFMKVFSTANTPNVFTLCDGNGKVIDTLEGNNDLLKTIKSLKLNEKQFLKVFSQGDSLNASIIFPPNFDSNKKYPVFMAIYGGPGNNTVEDGFSGADYFYHQLLAQKGYIIVSIDPHGTQYRGEKFKKSTYLQLGKLELEDFVQFAKYLKTLPYIDRDRIGIQGWSYGGYMSSLAITKASEHFKMAIAVAPVTNWRYYDNIYTERFMRTPQENAKGYDENSPINFVKGIKGKYFIIHGSADDNVHYQNTMEMVSSLTNANIPFDMFIYPNKNHGIYGGNTRNHLFNMLLNYTLNNL